MSSKHKPIFGLEKIPDSVLLKDAQREIGVLTSDRDEWKDKAESLQKKLDKKPPDVTNLQKQVSDLQKAVDRKNEKITKMGAIIDSFEEDERVRELEAEIRKLRIHNSQLQQDCVKLLKEKREAVSK